MLVGAHGSTGAGFPFVVEEALWTCDVLDGGRDHRGWGLLELAVDEAAALGAVCDLAVHLRIEQHGMGS